MKRSLIVLLLTLLTACQKELTKEPAKEIAQTTNPDLLESIPSPNDTAFFSFGGGTITDNGSPNFVCSLWKMSFKGDFDSVIPKRFKLLITKDPSVQLDSLIVLIDGVRFKKVEVASDTLLVSIASGYHKRIPKINPTNISGDHYIAIRRRCTGNPGDSYRVDILEASLYNITDSPRTTINNVGLPILGQTCTITYAKQGL